MLRRARFTSRPSTVPAPFASRFAVPASLFSAALLALLACAVPACSSDSDPNASSSFDGPDSGKIGSDAGPLPPGTTGITFPEGTIFPKRDCSLKVRYQGTAGDVRIAGEFTGWAQSPLPMSPANGGFEVVLEPSAQLQAGKLQAYKLVVDGNWVLDPAGKYRKILDGQMNSALKLPPCEDGPELRAETLSVAKSGDSGTMTVRVTTRTANDGDVLDRVEASLDKQPVALTAIKTDVAGGIDFAIPDLPKGKHKLSLSAVDAKGRRAEPVDLAFWVEDEAFDYRDGVLYMFLIDRFANGDKTNDKPVGSDVHYDADWHGGDLQGALEVMKAGYFEKLGVRTIWLSPLNAQTNNWHFGDGNQKFSAYHGYWPIKSREVEPRFGGDAALRAFVAEAHSRGLRVLLDLINNQVHKDHEYLGTNSDWFRQSCKCGDDGCGWSQRPFDCMFQPYLPDIDWNKEGAEKRFVDDAVNWIAEFDLDGFRVDAVKHVEANSVFNMRAELTRRFEQGGDRIFMVGETAVGENDSGTFFGETFSDGYAWIDAYTGPTALDGQFDFPTRHNMADGLVNGLKPLNEVEAALAKAESRYRPGNRHVRFLNGHDNPRIATIAAQDPKINCTWSSGCRDADLPPLAYDNPDVYVRLKRGLTVLYTLPGVPYLYAGDEVAFGGGPDPDMRRNMLFGEGLGSVEMAKTGTPPALTAAQTDLRSFTRTLGATRTSTRALRRGTRKTLLGDEADLWVYAYQSGPKEVAVVAINRGAAVSGRSIAATGLDLGGVSSFTSALGTGSAQANGGNVTISIGAGEAAIFVAK